MNWRKPLITWERSLYFAVMSSVVALGMTGPLVAQNAANVPRAGYAGFPPSELAMLDAAMNLGDQSFDRTTALLRNPVARITSRERMVRESSWYALGLLERDLPGDRARAAAVLEAVVAQQYLDPQTKWYGAFKRTPDEPTPKPNNVSHNPGVIGYDPNWREFIGTAFEIILVEYRDRVSPALAKKLNQSIALAVEGELNDGHVPPSYTNIALLFGALLDYASKTHPDWRPRAAEWSESVYRLFVVHKSFGEYNSPTYYGPDLMGLALWRSYGSTARIRSIGAEMEATLWKDTADFYSPTLRNMAGPYDRAYGMDMESYVAVMGIWIGTVVDPQQVPLPPITAHTDHVFDIWLVPYIVALKKQIPPPSVAEFRAFSGPHLITRRIDESRIATAWIGNTAMWGAQSTNHTLDVILHKTQFHPVTVHWRTPSGQVGWIQLTESPMIDAVADRNGITIDAAGDVTFRILAEGASPGDITARTWNLPGMQVAVDADEKNFSLNNPTLDAAYTGVTRIRLTFTPAKEAAKH